VSEPVERSYYAVLVPVGEECYATGHRLHPFDDAISCSDCELVAPRRSSRARAPTRRSSRSEPGASSTLRSNRPRSRSREGDGGTNLGRSAQHYEGLANTSAAEKELTREG
jgi:hypothetical protein